MKAWKRFVSLLLAAALGLSLAACGDKSGSDSAGPAAVDPASVDPASQDRSQIPQGVPELARETGYGYLAEYQELDGLKFNYVQSMTSVSGKLVFYGEYWDDRTGEGGGRIALMDQSTGEITEIPVPELLRQDYVNEYIMQFSYCPDGSGYWIAVERYVFDPGMMVDPGVIVYEDDMVTPGDLTDEPAEEAPPEPEEDLPVYGTAYDGADYQLSLLTDVVPLEPEETPPPEVPAAPSEAPDTPEQQEPEMPAPTLPEGMEPGESFYLRKCDLSGNVLLDIELTEMVKDLEYFYPQTMVQDQSGKLYISSDQMLLCLDENGKLLSNMPLEDVYLDFMTIAGDGTVVCSGWNMEAGGMGVFRLEENGLEKLQVEGISSTGGRQLYPGEGSTVLLSDGNLLYRLDVKTGKTEKLLSWLDSDINGNRVNAVIADGEDQVRVLLSEYRQSENAMVFELGTLSRVPASELPERTILTLGAVYLDENIKEQMIRFNRGSDTYRITLVDYSVYNSEEDYMAGANQLDKDIISGSCPDILSLESSDVTRYISKGALADLSAPMEADGFSRDMLVEGPLQMFQQDGKLYGLPMTFSLQTIYASEKLAGKRDGWTIPEMAQVVGDLPQDAKVMQWYTREDFLNIMLSQDLGQFVNYADGTCSFGGEDFAALLTAASKLPADYSFDEEGEMEYRSDAEMLQAGDILLAFGYCYDSWDLKNMYGMYMKDGIVRVGFPGAGNGARIQAGTGMAISSRCKDQAGAWAFLKTLLDEDYQNSGWGFPILKSAFDQRMETAMERDYYIDENGEKVYMDSETPPLTQEQVEDFRQYVAGAAPGGTYDQDIMEIVLEEAAAYFAGDKTAAQVADLIQSRVSIYLGEIS